MTTAKLRSRIRKLLRLSSSSNVHEATVAAQHAQRLAERHRIDLAALEPEEDHDSGVALSADDLDAGAPLAQWKVELAVVVAEANACRAIVQPGGRWQHLQLVGHDDDVAVVRELYPWLRDQLAKLVRRSRLRGAARLDSFRMGAISTLEERLEAARAWERRHARRRCLPPSSEYAAANAASTALALRSAQRQFEARTRITEQVVDDLCGGEEPSSVGLDLDAEAFVSGVVLGRLVELNSHGRL